MLSVYPESLDAEQWPRARQLGSSALELTRGDVPAEGAEKETSQLLGKIARYHQFALNDYEKARLSLREVFVFRGGEPSGRSISRPPLCSRTFRRC